MKATEIDEIKPRQMGLVPLILVDVGFSDYQATHETQLELVEKKKKDPAFVDHLIFVEHPEVYTFGRKFSGPVGNELPNAHLVERGGEATYHNPGQLVCYPILRLRERERDLNLYLRQLESVLVRLLADFGIEAHGRPGATGVWLTNQEKKIASIGVAISSWITYHGCALNVCNDLAGFGRIKPCGYSSEVMTSMKQVLGTSCPSLESVKEAFLCHFLKVFGRVLVV
ncbi:MAG: lipoyl(octanoyl) transferase LipB [Deltaproteobacteria bacterium]|nr:lipoyl(octanoyl) transferase LipB [Deltaproteobacteria bacterium]